MANFILNCLMLTYGFFSKPFFFFNRPKHNHTYVGNTRIHLTTERWRVCEAWFAPSIAGVDSAGLGEVIQNILSRFGEEEKGRLVKVGSFLC